MTLGLIFNFYQPSVQDKETFSKVVESSYIPLLKFIKNSKNVSFTLNIPLSTSFLLKERGYTDLLKTIKDLNDTEKIELTSTAAYFPMLSSLSAELIDKQIILNEFGLGYYFGRDKGFEGEDAILLKNINGFFAPFLKLNETALKCIDQLNYKWVIADSTHVLNTGTDASIFVFPEKNIKLVVPDTAVTATLASVRNTETTQITNLIIDKYEKTQELFVVVDASLFGYDFSEGMYFLDSLLESLKKLGIEITTVSNILSKANEEALPGLQTLEEIDINTYPSQFSKVLSMTDPLTGVNIAKDSSVVIDTLPIWDPQYISKLHDGVSGTNLLNANLYMQCMSYSQTDPQLKDRYLSLYSELGITA